MSDWADWLDGHAADEYARGEAECEADVQVFYCDTLDWEAATRRALSQAKKEDTPYWDGYRDHAQAMRIVRDIPRIT